MHGQQEAIIARLITPSDRQRWPEAFEPSQILLILNGHRVYFAQPKSKLHKLKVEVARKNVQVRARSAYRAQMTDKQ